MTSQIVDPYARCEDRCTHDLGRGVLLEELLATDGPHPSVFNDVFQRRPRLALEMHSQLDEAPAA